ncbi:MAG: peptidase and in kexin sedolisin [Betaproteobacteria bacterium]|nr:peptidase and in kexin sedolisin [Betaproteobacteria bacterium]
MYYTCPVRVIYIISRTVTFVQSLRRSIPPVSFRDTGGSISNAPLHDPNIVWVNGNPVNIPDNQWPAAQTPRAILRLAGPVQPEWRKRLAAAKLRVQFWCPPSGVCVDVPRAARNDLSQLQLDFVAGGVDYTDSMCQRPGLPASDDRAAAFTPALPSHLVDVVCFDRRTRAVVERELASRDIPVLHAGTTKLRVSFDGDLAVLRGLPGVKLAGPVRLPRLLSAAEIRASVGVPAAVPNPWGLSGEGEVIAVADTGLDSGNVENGMHPDFAGRIRALQSLPMNTSWRSFATARSAEDGADRASGHGTHVAGLALGSGAASRGVHGGLAPASQLVFLAIEQDVEVLPAERGRLPSGFYLAGRPVDLRELYRAGSREGATLHNLSWGDPAQGVYTDDCFETDLYLREAPDDVVVCAAGNDGTDRDGNRCVDNGSLYAPACAKNTIAVGATEGPVQGSGLRKTWGQLDATGRRWTAPSDRNDPISGEADRIAPMSSCGPTRDGRAKPDLCAPGTNLASTRSRATAYQGWGLADPLPLYMYDGGTSMAAPVVTGALALVRQAWRAHGPDRKRTPSGAALKALALLACTPVRGRGVAPAGRFEAGFGKLDVARALPPALKARDGWTVTLRDAASQRIDTGRHRDVAVRLAKAGRLRAVLCWYDPPGERLINDLDLTLLDVHKNPLAPDGGAAAATADRINTVECIDRTVLPAGRYFLRVNGFNVMDGPQRYALAWAVESAVL